ncbi:hypothetical protein GVN20_01660 [Runella sp. CRIBMP]|uniref:hypothetical protein n=1 Tax=Runella sp. CRIBMP TaxID=2683261 RepID=UPI001413248A|nr:hypothetical protein [Runella sp. CRIBMP]NBB18048.1 hypothetical protein [Runella sp. CRIBMP]
MTTGTFYNTTAENGLDLTLYKSKALAQDAKVLNFMLQNADQKFTICEIFDRLLAEQIIHEHTPRTSICRSLNTLMKEGKVSKLQEKRMGCYGRPNFLWRIQSI